LASKVTMRPSFLEPKLLEQDSCLTFCSHKVDAAVRSPLFVTFMFNMILSRGLHVSLITNATNMFFESKISVANRQKTWHYYPVVAMS